MKKILKFSLIIPAIFAPFCLLNSCSKKAGANVFCISNQNLFINAQTSGYIKIYNPVKNHNYGYIAEPALGTDALNYVKIKAGSGSDLVDFNINNVPSTDKFFKLQVTDNAIPLPDFDFEVTIHASTTDFGDAQTLIQNLSFDLRAGRKDIRGGCFNNSAVFGTAWICNYNTSDMSYDLMTNWHIEIDADSMDYSTLQFSYLYGGNMIGWENFASWKEIGHGHVSDAYPQSGTDMFEYNVKFKGDDANLVTKLSSIDSAFKDFSTSTIPTEQVTSPNETFYIGGFPGKVGNQKPSSFKWTFTAVHAYTAKGYEDRDQWDSPVQGETIGHFVGDGKHYSVANEVIMGGLQCNALEHGASGSLCLVKVAGVFKVFGIYWGGWKEDESKEFFGSVEPFNSAGTGIFNEPITNWMAYNPSTLFPA